MRFDNRVAIVTGAGGAAGLGRAYAMALAERGARVVVNDLGVGPDGRGIERAHADRVAEEIRELGGEAVADTNSVAGQESAEAIIRTALDTWGRIDIVVNNAGVSRPGEFRDATPEDIVQQVSVHLLGNIWMCRAAWPRMIEQEYGRIVNVTSEAMWGGKLYNIYGAAKGGIFSLSRGLAAEGVDYGIKVNTLAPAAVTTAARYFGEIEGDASGSSPEAVAPVVVYLCHQDCSLNGRYVWAGAGRMAIGVFGQTEEFASPGLTAEDVRDNMTTICSSPFAEFGDPLNITYDGPERPFVFTLKSKYQRR
jgi:NAD(P)-dependent dehydrogenase (short-subunit alcohol dehydrogenase family)